MNIITPLRITFKGVQQSALELLLEHYLYILHTDTGRVELRAIASVLVSEWLLKVKQKNILERQQSSYQLGAALRLALSCCNVDTACLHPLSLSVHEYLKRLNEGGLNIKLK
jgi:hypothetical protein